MAEISVEDLMKEASSIYEAVVVMSRRARQITDEQKLLLDMEKESEPVVDNKENEDFDEVEIDREALMRDHIKLPKPSRLAMEEMASGKIKYEFFNKEEEQQQEEK